MAALIVGVGDIFRAVRREGHGQDTVQRVIGILRDRARGGDALGQIASVVIVIDGRSHVCAGARSSAKTRSRRAQPYQESQ